MKNETFDEHDGLNTKYIVIYDDVLPIATVRLYPIGEDAMMLGRIVVLPEYRHRELGSMAVKAAEEVLFRDFVKSNASSGLYRLLYGG